MGTGNDSRQRTDDRGQKTENRGQMTDDRAEMREDSEQITYIDEKNANFLMPCFRSLLSAF
jgi:hypothetical protein